MTHADIWGGPEDEKTEAPDTQCTECGVYGLPDGATICETCIGDTDDSEFDPAPRDWGDL